MKKAFTMIELIFVIVILGILAAVALPKFVGVASQAREGNLKSFVATLNGTIGPTWWSKVVSSDSGDVSKVDGGIDSIDKLKKYTDVPKELSKFDLTKCDDSSLYKVIATFDKAKLGTDVNYYVACKDGTVSEAPKFLLLKPTTTSDDGLSLGDQNKSDIQSDETINIADKNQTVVQQ